MTTLAEHIIVVGAENRPLMLEKSMYDSWAAKDIWDKVKMLMKGTELSYQERECRLYNLFDKFAHVLGEDPIECINKVMEFQSAVVSRFSPSNNQLRTSSNPRNQATIQDEAQEAGQILDDKKFAFLADPDDLDAYNSNCDDLSSAKTVLMANLSSYDPEVLSEVPYSESYLNDMINQDVQEMQYSEQTHVDNFEDNEIHSEHAMIYVTDDEETLILEDKSRSKMLDKQNDLISIEKKIKISPIDYSKLNKIKEDFGTPITSHTPVRIETPIELPKVSLVNESLKKLKYQLANFDKVVKKRLTFDAITAGSWGFEHTKECFLTEIIPFLKVLKDTFNAFDKTLLDEITEVQTIFNQMEAAVDQCSVDKNIFEIQIKQLRIDNDQLLNQIMSQEIVLIVANYVDICDVKKSSVNDCKKCLELEIELFKKKDFVEKETYDKLVKTQSQEKDTVIRKLKERIKSLSGKDSVENVKKDIDEIETINIELEHKPISPWLKNNRDGHEVYIKKTIEYVVTLCGFVERARTQYPSEPLLEYACMFTKHVQELLLYAFQTCPNSPKPSEKLVVVTPTNKDKRVKFAEPVTSSSNIPKQTDSLKTKDSNKPLLTSIGGSNATDVPYSSSLINDRSSRSSSNLDPSNNILREEKAAYVIAFNEDLIMSRIDVVSDSNGVLIDTRLLSLKKLWDVVANDVTRAVQEFFTNSKLLKELNHTIIALIPKVREDDSFTYHRYCDKLDIINLCFADDLFLFANGDANYAQVIMGALDEFKLALGLTPSLPKSTAYFCNVLNHTKLSILNILPFEEGHLSVKYLGVSLISSRLIYWDCRKLIEKCQGDMRRGKAKVVLEVGFLPKKEGGLGLRRLDIFNKALMVSHIWSLLSLKESL
ncbi:hypothetical protein Tco_0776910 [Tanacetum coccineum]